MNARRLRDAALLEHRRHAHADSYGVYGGRKMRHVLRREGIAIGRPRPDCQIDAYGRSIRQRQRNQLHAQGPDLLPDLDGRALKAAGPNGCRRRTSPTYGHEKDSCIPLL